MADRAQGTSDRGPLHAPASRAQRVALAVIVAAALAVRLAYVALAPMPALQYDALGYDTTARRLMQHHYYAYGSSGVLTLRPNAVAMPGYPAFLAAVYEADDAIGLGRDLGLARALQALMGAAAVLSVYLIAARLAGPSAGLVAAVLAAAYPPAVLATGALWTEALFTFLLLGTVLLTLRATELPSVARFALAGVALGLALYVRPPALLWAPFAAGYGVWVLGWRRGLAYAGVAAAAAVLVLAPWWVRNARVYDRFVPFNTLNARPLLETSVPQERVGPIPNDVTWPPALLRDEFALNAYWKRLAERNDAAWWGRDPRDFLALHLYRAIRQARDPWFPVAGDPPAWLVAVTRSWHALLLVMAGGALLALRRDARVWLLASIPVTTFVLYALTFPDRRYMYPNTPLLAVFAGVTIVALVRRAMADAAVSRERRAWTALAR